MTIGPEDWEPQEPAPDFADQVMARIRRDTTSAALTSSPARRRIPLRAGVAGGLALAAAVLLAIAWRSRLPSDHGDATATTRTEVHLGERAIAVLEPGARVSWNGDDVSQPTGDVFYRVEPGATFHVETPAGDVQVLGTCFRVRVDESEGEMIGRDLKAGAVGAALTAAAFVSVYEGKVALSHASERVTLTAGESARADRAGVTRTHGGESGDANGNGVTEANGGAAADISDPLVAANANLADAVRDYKRRLEATNAQKATLEKRLSDAQQKLALEQSDGQVGLPQSQYDLSQDDWKELAKEGTVRARTPCNDPAGWTLSPDQLAKTGLPPGDAPAVHDALQQSSQSLWSVIRPLCVQALQGDAKVADKLGPMACSSLVGDMAKVNNEDTDEELREVAEMRAGLRPYNPSALGTYGQILYAQSGAAAAMEQQLAQSIGPTDARNFIYGDNGCWSSSSMSVGPRKTATGSPQ